jgi:nucleotide-binding universal stress UspA family protein
MIEKILVPTDGSPDSEKALAIAQRIAQAHGAELLLARAAEPVSSAYSTVHEGVGAELYATASQEIEAEAQRGLQELDARLSAQGSRTRTVLLRGTAAGALLDCEAREAPDLVVIASHGRGGLARFALGSVADRLVREGHCAVLVVRRTGPDSNRMERALVMLDGSGLAEEVLPEVEALAGKPITAVRLFRVVADPSDREAALNYLRGVAARLASHFESVETVVDTGEPRRLVARAAEDVDVVALCTHGRSGFDRLRHGSVAEYVTREVDKPALLVRAKA